MSQKDETLPKTTQDKLLAEADKARHGHHHGSGTEKTLLEGYFDEHVGALKKEISWGRAWENWTSIVIFSLFVAATIVVVLFVVSVFIFFICVLWQYGIMPDDTSKTTDNFDQLSELLKQLNQLFGSDTSLVYLAAYITVPTLLLVLGNFRRRGRVKSLGKEFGDGILKRLGEGLGHIFKKE